MSRGSVQFGFVCMDSVVQGVLEQALIESIADNKPSHADKVRALIEEKRQQVGSEKLREEVLKACENISHPIRGVVEQTLKETSQQPN